jgi:hypothetical protein
MPDESTTQPAIIKKNNQLVRNFVEDILNRNDSRQQLTGSWQKLKASKSTLANSFYRI